MIRAANFLTLSAALLAALVAASGCGKAVDETDSESHFLAFCTDECGEGLSCVCGVCTKPCAGDGSCDNLAFGGRCAPLAVSSCSSGSTLACDVECTTDSDCSGIGARHECLAGRCRAGLASDGDVITNDPELNDPIVLPALIDGCCPQISISWAQGYTLETDCRFERGGSPVDLCESQLPTTCNDPLVIDGADISAALRHPDMTSLLSRARDVRAPELVFGWNGGDASVSAYRLSLTFLGRQRGSEFFVASVYPHDCSEVVAGVSAPSECLPIPAGVRAYAELEQTLLMQQRSLGTCAPDFSCYAPPSIETCLSPTGARYDIESRRCVAGPPCAVSGEFDSLLTCERACDNDPCALGTTITDDAACSGVSTRLLAAPEASRCFANEAQACICACAQTGGALDSCVIQQGVVPEAVCGP